MIKTPHSTFSGDLITDLAGPWVGFVVSRVHDKFYVLFVGKEKFKIDWLKTGPRQSYRYVLVDDENTKC